MSMEKLGAFVGGALFATVGAKILASKDAQKVYAVSYTHLRAHET